MTSSDRALRPLRWPRLWIAAWIAMIAVVLIGSLLPAQRLPPPAFDGVDKLQHLLGYALLAGYAVLLFARTRLQLFAMAGLVALGIGIEFAQDALTTSRRADVADVGANTLGVLLGWSVQRMRLREALVWIEAAVGRVSVRTDR
jgi:VanZ family protein